MAKLSLKRQALLQRDTTAALRVYAATCARFGHEAVAQAPSLAWTMRCMWGVQGVLPFQATEATNASEWLYITRMAISAQPASGAE